MFAKKRSPLAATGAATLVCDLGQARAFFLDLTCRRKNWYPAPDGYTPSSQLNEQRITVQNHPSTPIHRKKCSTRTSHRIYFMPSGVTSRLDWIFYRCVLPTCCGDSTSSWPIGPEITHIVCRRRANSSYSHARSPHPLQYSSTIQVKKP